MCRLKYKIIIQSKKVGSYLDNLKNLISKVLKLNNLKKNLQIIFWNSTFHNTNFLNIKNFSNQIEKKINTYNNFLFSVSKK